MGLIYLLNLAGSPIIGPNGSGKSVLAVLAEKKARGY